MPSPSSQIILVTGSSSGFGFGAVSHLASLGHTVYASMRDAVRREALFSHLKDVPGRVHVCEIDVTDPESVQRTVQMIATKEGFVDVLVNNASSFYRTPVGAIDEAAWVDLVGSNFKAPLFLSQAAAPHLRPRRGCIVNITDVHAERPLKGYPLYSAAKAGLLGLTRALAQELAPDVRVNAVAPGPIAWPENDMDFPPEERAAILAHTPLGRTGTPADIATAVRFLAFEAPYVTGQVLNVDGGRTARL